MSETNDGRQTNSIADQIGMDLGVEEDDLGFDWSEDSDEVYDDVTEYGRSPVFDILWNELGEYPPIVDDDVVAALIDDNDEHEYRIAFGDREETVKVSALAMFAHLDPDVDVEVVA